MIRVAHILLAETVMHLVKITCNFVTYFHFFNFKFYLLTVRHYEVVYLIHEDHVEEVDSVVSKVQGICLSSTFFFICNYILHIHLQNL